MNRLTVVALAGLALLAQGCRPAPKAVPAPAPSAQSDYVGPPELKSATRAAEDSVVLNGSSRPGARVRLGSPDGGATGANATLAGSWSLVLDPADGPRLFSLSEDVAGHPLRARGYILLLPAPGPVATILRPGASAESLSPPPALQITALDFDRSGAAVASGVARPGETVRVWLDGAEAGEDRVNDVGGFSVSLAQSLRQGPHQIIAASENRRVSASFQASPAGPIERPPFNAARAGDSWRIDWMTPGGGVQTTLLFDPKGAAA